MRIGLTGGASTPDKIVDQAVRAEADGFSALWYASAVQGDRFRLDDPPAEQKHALSWSNALSGNRVPTAWIRTSSRPAAMMLIMTAIPTVIVLEEGLGFHPVTMRR